MITGGKNVVPRDTDQASELGQGRAFVIVGVAKAQIDGIALIMEFRLFRARLLDELRNPVHLFVIRRDQTFQTFGMINQARFCFLIYKIDNLGEDGLRRVKKLSVLERATLVPVAKGFPFLSILPWTKHVAFARENEIGPHGKGEIGEAGFKEIDRAAGIDCEKRAVVLQIADQFHATIVEHRLAHARDESAIEIDTEKFNLHCMPRRSSWRRRGDLTIDSITRKSKRSGK